MNVGRLNLAWINNIDDSKMNVGDILFQIYGIRLSLVGDQRRDVVRYSLWLSGVGLHSSLV